MKKGLLVGLMVSVAGGVVMGVILALSHRCPADVSGAGSVRPLRSFAPFRNRVSIRFEEPADFIKPSI
jgi:hypothetical protein